MNFSANPDDCPPYQIWMSPSQDGHIFAFSEIAADLPDRAGASLDVVLPWRHDGYGFREAVAEHARTLGFG